MQFIDLQRQYTQLKDGIDKAIHGVLDKSNFIMGEEVKELEQQLAQYVGVKHCITCGNGTDALSLAMMAYDIKKGDAVFVPDFTFYASAETVSLTGARPIFIDIDARTFNISAIDLEKAIQETIEKAELKPRAVIAVDLFGLPFEYDSVKAIADKYNLILIEDGAQGFGGSIGGRRSCSFGDISTTSFFPAKPLGCYGDGGAIFTNEDKVCEYLNSLKIHGKGQDKYDNVRVGLNSRLDTIQAAVLIEKLDAFKNMELELRGKVAELYNQQLGESVIVPYIPKGYTSSYAQYSILLENEEQRGQVQGALKENNIPSMIYYKKCMHEQTVYRNNSSIYRGFKNAEEVSKRILNLPMDPYINNDEIKAVCESITRSVQNRS
jgi:dTDP-4-amino-4,6-dideoxygalactose transaminase